MKFGYLMMEGRGAAALALAALAERLRRDGVRLAGVVQTEPADADRHPCETALRVLPDGPTLPIHQNLGSGSRGCRLDAGALEMAVVAAAAGLDGAEVMIVNKFGTREASGHGFCGLIVDALSRDIPVVVGVNGLNLPALRTFAGDLAEQLVPREEEIIRWLQEKRMDLARPDGLMPKDGLIRGGTGYGATSSMSGVGCRRDMSENADVWT
ncbi:DUF2478 domain-containing protein [Amaricoccus sp. B4]|uniref:DUF2478 domain-containing protein n=1 Tax=Amaricoccus sp. B4 TaxID=3368557 RepID=UPI003715A2B2